MHFEHLHNSGSFTRLFNCRIIFIHEMNEDDDDLWEYTLNKFVQNLQKILHKI